MADNKDRAVGKLALDQAIAVIGRPTEFARRLKVSRQNVQYWRATGRVPFNWALEIERLTGVSRSALRPDIYPPEENQAAPQQ
jgi:DNA-binding transcriptional regulator YdaS (Cro superfamily)